MKIFIVQCLAFCGWVASASKTSYLRSSIERDEKKAVHPANVVMGEWLQLYSNFYVQSTSEIDFHCVKVNTSWDQNTNLVTVNKQAFLHGNLQQPIYWHNQYNLTYSQPTTPVPVVDDNLLLRPIKNTSFLVVPLWLRSSSDDYLIWTGLDNKTMYVWAKTVDQFENTNILTELTNLDFRGPYKTAKKSYALSCPA